MAQRHAPVAPIGQYQPLHVSATGTAVPVGQAVDTTSATTITGGSVAQAVTPLSMNGIRPGKRLVVSGGTGTAEVVQVSSTTSTTFTATFANAHSGAYHIMSLTGTFLGTVVINKVGTGDSITLYNGSPNANSYNSSIGNAIAVITPAAGANFAYHASCDFGLYYTVAGTPGDYTITYIDQLGDVV